MGYFQRTVGYCAFQPSFLQPDLSRWDVGSGNRKFGSREEEGVGYRELAGLPDLARCELCFATVYRLQFFSCCKASP